MSLPFEHVYIWGSETYIGIDMARTNDGVRYPVEFRVSFILESRITSIQSTPCVGEYEANGHNCENWGNGLYLSLLYIRRFIHRSIES